MFNLKNDVLNKLICLYNMYEKYAVKNKNTKMNILVQDGSIGFYLYNDKESIDEFIITFSDKENKLYKYVSIEILIRLINDMIVYYNDNEFYNDMKKPYLRLIVNDDKILGKMKELILRQYYEVINDKTDIVREFSDNVPYTLFYPFRFMNRLNERINLSKKLLKAGALK